MSRHSIKHGHAQKSALNKMPLIFARTVSTYTTIDWLFSRAKGRWLTGLEIASLAFPVTTDVAAMYGCVPLLDSLGAMSRVSSCIPI